MEHIVKINKQGDSTMNAQYMLSFLYTVTTEYKGEERNEWRKDGKELLADIIE